MSPSHYEPGDVEQKFTAGAIIDAFDYAKQAATDQDIHATPEYLLGFLLGMIYTSPRKVLA